MGFFVLIVGVIIGAWRLVQPAAAPVPTAMISIRPEELRSFVDQYDEKRHLQRNLEALETQAKKGKIPRRRYKVRKMTFESRLSALSRDLKTLEEKIRAAGPRYADLMHQLEVAETALEGVEADINRTEIRYRRGELSPTVYNKHLEDAYRRRDRARTTIDGVLLRLKEEIV
jgi:chromosome segregation ATPase